MSASPQSYDELPLLPPPEDESRLGSEPAYTSTKVGLLRQIMSHIPVTEAGLPEYLVRADMLPAVASPKDLRVDEAEAAQIPISYAQGYPSFADTEQPLWFQAPHESDEAFEAFRNYLNEGANTGFRTLVAANCPIEQAHEWFYLYFWAVRASAHDMYRHKAHGILTAERQISMRDSHFEKGDTLLQKAFDKLTKEDADFSPRELIELGKLGASLQRGAVDADGNGKKKVFAEAEIAVRGGMATRVSPDSLVDVALRDPEAAQLLQQVMVKLRFGSTE